MARGDTSLIRQQSLKSNTFKEDNVDSEPTSRICPQFERHNTRNADIVDGGLISRSTVQLDKINLTIANKDKVDRGCKFVSDSQPLKSNDRKVEAKTPRLTKDVQLRNSRLVKEIREERAATSRNPRQSTNTKDSKEYSLNMDSTSMSECQ